MPGSLQRVGPLAGHWLGGERASGLPGSTPPSSTLGAASWKCRAGQEPSVLGSPCSASAITHESQQAEEGQTEPSRRVTAPVLRPAWALLPAHRVAAQPRELPPEQAPLPTAGWQEAVPWPCVDGLVAPAGVTSWAPSPYLASGPSAHGGQLTHPDVLVSQTRATARLRGRWTLVMDTRGSSACGWHSGPGVSPKGLAAYKSSGQRFGVTGVCFLKFHWT